MDINIINNIIWSIDEEDGILDYQLPNGLCIWLLIRYHVYTLLFKKSIEKYRIDGTHQVSSSKAKRNAKFFLLSYWVKSFQKSPFVAKKKIDCINVCSSIACYPTAKGYRNRMTGFLNDFKSFTTLHLIRSDNGAFREKYEGDYCFYDSILLKEKIKQKLSNKKRHVCREFAEIIEKKLVQHLNTAELETISSLIEIYSIEASGIEKSFRTLLTNTRPELILIEDANYGTLDTCTLLMVAKQMDIKTAEVQHGIFDIGFQYSKDLLKNPLFAFHKTDYILTFGDYFSEFIQSSSKKISLGNQFLEDQKKKAGTSTISGECIKILFITQREFTDRLIPVIYSALRSLKKTFEFVIRLHPSEAGHTTKYKRFLDFTGTKFSIDDNVYEQIASADFIIGSYSTLLTESIYFDKQPFIHKNDLSDRFVPDGIGIRFSDAEELVDLLSNEVPVIEKEQKEYFWKQGCKDNFERFYRTEIIDAHNKKETVFFNENLR